MSISPGVTSQPEASITSSADPAASRPSPAIFSPTISTSIFSSISCDGSITRPPRIRMLLLMLSLALRSLETAVTPARSAADGCRVS
jgi:hypothetical protein